jgi:hypothetical protein
MVISANERSAKKPAKQGFAEETRKPIQINGSTHYDFEGKNLTAYGGLLPVAAMLEKLKFQQLVEGASVLAKRKFVSTTMWPVTPECLVLGSTEVGIIEGISDGLFSAQSVPEHWSVP